MVGKGPGEVLGWGAGHKGNHGEAKGKRLRVLPSASKLVCAEPHTSVSSPVLCCVARGACLPASWLITLTTTDSSVIRDSLQFQQHLPDSSACSCECMMALQECIDKEGPSMLSCMCMAC